MSRAGSTVFRSSLPFDETRIGAAAIYCSDGRYNEMFDQFLHESLKLPRYDRLVLPGGPAALAGHIVAYREEQALDSQLRFLVDSHNLGRIVLIAHQGCGFYHHRLSLSTHEVYQQQIADLKRVAERIRRATARVEVSAFFARRDGNKVAFDAVRT